MTKDYNSYTKKELLELNMNNFCKLFEWYTNSPRGSKYQDHRIRRFETERPDPLWNGVLTSNHMEYEVDEAIKQQLEYYKSKGKLGMMWYTYPSTQPANMNKKLESHGFNNIAQNTPLMSIDLENLPESIEVPGLEIRPVRTEEEMQTFNEVIGSRWDLGEGVFKMKYDVECKYGFDEDSPRQMYLGYLDDVPVSSNFLIYDSNVVGLYKTATVSRYEKRGIGTAMTLKPLFDAQDRGYKVAILQSTPMGYKVYVRLGFREDGQMDWFMYTWAQDVKTL
ncbi:MAG: hypothetical protein ACFFCW_27115 [Candidatus Hodarchaeota archaeon]